MEIKLLITLPDGRWRDVLAGVYRIDFDNGYFYIGSSAHLRRRAGSWKSIFISKCPTLNRNHIWPSFIEKIESCSVAELTIVRLVDTSADLRKEEALEMATHKQNGKLINKLYPKTGVIQKTADGVEVCQYETLQGAARATGLFTRRIQDVLNGRRKTCHGFTFEYQDPLRKKPLGYYKKAKPLKIFRYSLSGEYIDGFVSIASASRAVSRDRKGVLAAITGKQKSCGGYRFKRA